MTESVTSFSQSTQNPTAFMNTGQISGISPREVHVRAELCGFGFGSVIEGIYV